ncbi:hypothetical protein [Actibacterium sp. 188UL27-1]|uniref:hypothetical protein n=1 Tax=Actibacterium sp. 188UL27-1 TaxID=2786961 RepID=UPI001956075B|nr:hypothetical protein [Actibacterium sp. 188UL27-1]
MRGCVHTDRASCGKTFAVLTIHDFFRRHGVSYKKTTHASEQERPDVAERRVARFKGQPDLDPSKLVFLDETGATTKMPVCAVAALMVNATAPHGYRKTILLIAGGRLDGQTAPMMVDGDMSKGNRPI